MILGIFGFLNLSFTDVLDILMVATIIYFVFRWIRGSAAMNIFIAILGVLILRVFALALNMKLMSAILGTFIDVGVLALIVIFQPEIRHFLMRIGSKSGLQQHTFFHKFFGIKDQKFDSTAVNEISDACKQMSEQRTGALIVFPHENALTQIIETGDRIDAIVSKRLIMNLFFKNSPLHDGAMIITGNRIVASRCTLPITERTDIPANYGMRHKAAIGISEETDADVIVVSEETGVISFVQGGTVTPMQSINELKLKLSNSLDGNSGAGKTENEQA
ncbi:MAG: diadenylate cyclase CdaA [Bacteroidales bacterium]|nr:diadenylate cyclase CdaA [Bacteroidales bacterium]